MHIQRSPLAWRGTSPVSFQVAACYRSYLKSSAFSWQKREIRFTSTWISTNPYTILCAPNGPAVLLLEIKFPSFTPNMRKSSIVFLPHASSLSPETLSMLLAHTSEEPKTRQITRGLVNATQ